MIYEANNVILLAFHENNIFDDLTNTWSHPVPSSPRRRGSSVFNWLYDYHRISAKNLPNNRSVYRRVAQLLAGGSGRADRGSNSNLPTLKVSVGGGW